MAGRTSLTLAEGMTGMMENVFINVKNKSKTITAEVEVPKGGANGTIIAQGGRFGGWSLYVKDGVPAYDYNFLGHEARRPSPRRSRCPRARRRSASTSPTTAAGSARAAPGTLFVNGEKVAEGRIEHTQPMIFSADETADVGIDLGHAGRRGDRLRGEVPLHGPHPEGHGRDQGAEAGREGRREEGGRRGGDEEGPLGLTQDAGTPGGDEKCAKQNE